MLNKSTSRSEDIIQSGVDKYPIEFAFQYNGDDTPQIRVTIGAMIAEENVHFVITEDLLNIKLIPLEEEAPTDPNDYSWLEKWVGLPLVIERDIPFVQESDYQVGRISPERIEKDFDLSVMRDQILDDKIDEAKAVLQKDIDDKLPLAGGEVSGDVSFRGVIDLYDYEHRGASFVPYFLGGMYIHTNKQTRFYFTDDFYVSNLKVGGESNLGTDSLPWATAYVKKINNGADISVPTEGGTFARLEDIPETYTKEELDAKFAEVPGAVDLSDYATIEYAEELYFDLHGKLDQEISKRFSEDRQLYNNQIVLRNMLNEKDENDEFIKLTTEAQTAIPAINELKARLDAGGGGGAEIGSELDVEYKITSWFYGFNSSDGYFFFDNIHDVESPEDVNCFALTNQVYSGSPNISIVNRSYGAYEDGEHYSFTEEWFGPGAETYSSYPKNLGRDNAPWKTLYVESLCAQGGEELLLPTEGGTLARLEDLEGIGGASLPDQTGNAGKFLATDGTTVSWGDALANKSSHAKATAIGYNKTIKTWTDDIYIGTPNSTIEGNSTGGLVIIGASAAPTTSGCYNATAVGTNAKVGALRAIAIGTSAEVTGKGAIQISSALNPAINSDDYTFKVANENGNFEMMSADGTIPADRMSAVSGTTGQVLTKTDTGMAWQDAAGGGGDDCGLIIRRL